MKPTSERECVRCQRQWPILPTAVSSPARVIAHSMPSPAMTAICARSMTSAVSSGEPCGGDDQ